MLYALYATYLSALVGSLVRVVPALPKRISRPLPLRKEATVLDLRKETPSAEVFVRAKEQMFSPETVDGESGVGANYVSPQWGEVTDKPVCAVEMEKPSD